MAEEQVSLSEEKKSEEQKIAITRPPTFLKVYATNILVTATDSDFRIELFNEKFKTDEGWVYQSEALIMLTRESAKKLLLSLDEKIKDYEKQHGEIPVSEDRGKLRYLIS